MAKKVAKNKTKEVVKEKPKPLTLSKSTSKSVPKITAPKNVITSYSKIDDNLKRELIKKYPDGFSNYLKRYPKPNGEFFLAVPLDVEDMHYLIKVEVKVDNLITDDDFDKHFGDISEVSDKAIGDVEIPDDDEEEDNDESLDNDDGDDDE